MSEQAALTGTTLADRCITLRELLSDAPPHQEPSPGFIAWYEGRPWRVTAVLERTAVLTSLVDDDDRILKRFELVAVLPRTIHWRPRAISLHRSPMVSPTDVVVARARRQYEMERGRRKAHATRTWSGVLCSRPGCGVELAKANKSGVCTACQRVCPICGEPKANTSQRCLSCWEAGR